MSLKIDRLQLEIIINNDQARKSLRALDEEARLINKELKGLTQGTQEWIQKSDRLKTIKQQMDSIYEKIGLTGLSLKELTTRQKELNMVLLNMDPRLPQHKQYQEQLKTVTNRISELLQRMTTHVTEFATIAGVPATVNFEYGLATAYGNNVTATQSPVSGSAAVKASAPVTGLQVPSPLSNRITHS